MVFGKAYILNRINFYKINNFNYMYIFKDLMNETLNILILKLIDLLIIYN